MTNFYEFECGCRIPILNEKLKEFDGLPSMKIDFYNIREDCPATWDLISTGHTKGIFQLEKQLGQTWSKKLAPRNFEEMSALISLIRPGCLKAFFRNTSDAKNKNMTEHYVDRKHGREEVLYMHPALEPILAPTYGILTYQEQSLRIAANLAGFDLKQADNLRRAMGKKKADLMEEIKSEFIEGCKRVGVVNEAEADEIFGWIEKSNRYSFNKSHGIGYGVIGYWSAYMKAHFPFHFYSACLNYVPEEQNSQTEARELISDAKIFNIDILPPRISTLFKNEGNCVVKDDKIYFGIRNIKSLGDKQVIDFYDRVLEQEKVVGKELDRWNWWEILTMLLPNLQKTVVNNLIASGVFSHLQMSRGQMLYEYSVINELKDRELKWIVNNRKQFTNIKDALATLVTIPRKLGGPFTDKRTSIISSYLDTFSDELYDRKDTAEWIANKEQELFGVALTCSRIDDRNTELANCTCADFIHGRDGECIIAVEVLRVTEYIIPQGKNKGNKMGFLTVQDNTASLDCVIFSNIWDKYNHILVKGNTVVLSGKRSNRDSFQVNKVIQI